MGNDAQACAGRAATPPPPTAPASVQLATPVAPAFCGGVEFMLRTRMSSDISLPAPVSAPTIDAPPRRGLVASAVVAVLLTVAPGFVTMALLGSLRSYAPKLPGFWDYPS